MIGLGGLLSCADTRHAQRAKARSRLSRFLHRCFHVGDVRARRPELRGPGMRADLVGVDDGEHLAW